MNLHVVDQGEADVRPPSRESTDEEREEKEPWPDDHSSSRYLKLEDVIEICNH